jgi:4-carboxymuconolactone decarboxylase
MRHIKLILIVILSHFALQVATGQEKIQMVRLAKLVIDSTQLDSYKAFLKEEIETSLRVEPGVLTLYAVSEKRKPTHITILEIYADLSKGYSLLKRRFRQAQRDEFIFGRF